MSRHYTNAPIVEAIIDLRIAQPSGVDLQVLKSFSDLMKDQFPTTKEISSVTMGFQHLKQGSEGQFLTQQVGLRLENNRGDRVLQVQRIGFTYSHLAPYSNWNSFRDEAKALWSRYLAATGIAAVTRLAVRVINRLHIPAPIAELSRYSNLVARLPDGIPTHPDAFFTQVQLNGSTWADGCSVLVDAGAVPQTEGKVELLFDFDIFVEATKDASSNELWQLLDKLSAAKDDLFEACITDKTRELIA
jgi:uncharacterized protein (TIGR04255 family)